MNSIHEILETVVTSLESEVTPDQLNEKLQKIQDHLKGRTIPPVTSVKTQSLNLLRGVMRARLIV